MKNKNYLLLSIICLFTLLASAQDNVTVNLSGKITNPNSDTLLIKDGWGEQYHLITLTKDGSFSTEFDIPSGYYRINDLHESTTVYFGKDYDISLTLDTDSFDESIRYSGIGSEANNYLAKKALIEESWGNLKYYSYYCRLEENSFLSLTDSLYNSSLQILRSQTIPDTRFTKLEYQGVKNEKSYKLNTYPGTYRLLTKDKEYIESSNFPDPFENFDISNPELITSPRYISTIISYLYYHRDTAAYRKTGDYYLYQIQSMAEKIDNEEVKKHAVHYFSRNAISSTKEIDEYYEIYKSIETDPKRLRLIEYKYLARKKTQKGEASPPFSYEGVDGKIITQEDLMGKLVYIDLWATWCGPCLREIPYFDTLQNAFKGREITFISICQNDTKKRWKQAVEVKNLKGLQLFAAGDGGQFYEDYQVTGIPRYIILDTEGKIIDSDAKRPSDKRLVAELENLLK